MPEGNPEEGSDRALTLLSWGEGADNLPREDPVSGGASAAPLCQGEGWPTWRDRFRPPCAPWDTMCGWPFRAMAPSTGFASSPTCGRASSAAHAVGPRPRKSAETRSGRDARLPRHGPADSRGQADLRHTASEKTAPSSSSSRSPRSSPASARAGNPTSSTPTTGTPGRPVHWLAARGRRNECSTAPSPRSLTIHNLQHRGEASGRRSSPSTACR